MGEFFTDYQNNSSPMNKCYLRFLKHECVFFQIVREAMLQYYQLIIYIKKVLLSPKK